MKNAIPQELMDLIKIEAFRCLRKLPSKVVHELDSLINEGVLVFLSAKQSGTFEPGTAEWTTYFFRCLQNRWKDLLNDSYHHPVCVDCQEFEGYTPCLRSNDPGEIAEVIDMIHQMAREDTELITLLLDPPQSLTTALEVARYNHRKLPWKTVVRQFAGKSYVQDLTSRRRIHKALTLKGANPCLSSNTKTSTKISASNAISAEKYSLHME